MAKKWYADKRPSGGSAGCVTNCPMKSKAIDQEESFVCWIQQVDATPPYSRSVPLHETRCELIAMLPELVEAASLLNSLAGWGTRNTLPSVKRKLPKIDKLIRKAVELLANEPDLEGGAK
jgi:hypothetical protein